MNHYVVSGFIKRCHQRGITKQANINYLFKLAQHTPGVMDIIVGGGLAPSPWYDKQEVITGLLGAGLGGTLGGLLGYNVGGGAGALTGGLLGAGGGGLAGYKLGQPAPSSREYRRRNLETSFMSSMKEKYPDTEFNIIRNEDPLDYSIRAEYPNRDLSEHYWSE